MKLYKLTLFALLAILFASCNKDDDEDSKSNEKQILEFSIDNNKAEIDQAGKTIKLNLPGGADLTKLKPEIKISDKASVNPVSGIETNFTNPVTYTVTAQDGSKQEYIVTVATISPIERELHLITKVIEIKNDRASTVAEFSYNDKNKLISYKDIDPGHGATTIDFTYNLNNDLSKFTVIFDEGDNIEYNLTYKDSKTVEVSYPDENTMAKDIYKVNDKGLLEQFTENPDGGDGTWLKFEYDSRGNVLKIIDEENNYDKYTYDEKNSFFKDLTIPQWISHYILERMKTPNNILTHEYYENGILLHDATQKYTYTYNEKGYPVSYLYENDTEKTNYKIEYKIVVE